MHRHLLAATFMTGTLLMGGSALYADAPATSEKQAAEKQPIPAAWTFLGAEGLPQQIKDQIQANLMPLVGKPAPALSLADFRNTEAITEKDFKGKITIVDVWATWCGPCIVAIPKNNALQEKYADQGVVVLGVTTSGGQENLEKVLADHPIHYPLAKDPQQKTLAAWKASFFPTYYAVDRDGIVRGVALSPGHLEDVVQFLLKEQPAKTAGADEAANAE